MDMRFICPRDVKKMLLKQVTTTYWKKCASRHECEEIEQRSLGLTRLMLCCEGRQERIVEKQAPQRDENIVVEMATRMYDTGWSDEKKCRGCDKEDGTEKHKAAPFPVQEPDPGGFGALGTNWQKAAKEDWK